MPESKENFTENAERVSKSQRRREALEAKTLAARLIALNPGELAGLPLDQPQLNAIAEARRIRSNVARKRQLQYVAKLLRRADLEPVLAALENREQEARRSVARHHRVEEWRDHLLQAGDSALSELLDQRPGADGQELRQHLRRARQEAARGRPPAAARRLFRLLRDMDEAAPLPPPGDAAG
jgi:ribosome-associated protein